MNKTVFGTIAGSLIIVAVKSKFGSFGSGRKPREWTEDEIAVLGSVSDRQASRILGIGRLTIANKRDELGIEEFDRSRQWTADEIALLGTMEDKEVAEILGIGSNAVLFKRKELEIDPLSRSREWTEQELSLLGTMSDQDLATRLNISRSCVTVKRSKLEIPKFDRSRQWSERQLSLLGTMGDKQIADMLGISKMSVSRKRKKLGKQSNRARLARQKREKIEQDERKIREESRLDRQLNPDLLDGEEFVTKSSSLLKGKKPIPSDAGNLPRYVGGKRWLSPGRRDRGGKK